MRQRGFVHNGIVASSTSQIARPPGGRCESQRNLLHGAKLGPIIKPMANLNSANDNGSKIHTVSMGALACYAGGRFVFEIPGCPVVVTKLTTKGGRTKGFELSLNGKVLAVLGARATYDHLEAACAAYAAAS